MRVALIVRQPFLNQILSGKKTVEYRTRRTPDLGTIGLIEQGKPGLLVGQVDIAAVSFLPESERPTSRDTYAYHLANPVRYSTPKRIEQKRGAVIWVRLAANRTSAPSVERRRASTNATNDDMARKGGKGKGKGGRSSKSSSGSGGG